MLTVLASINQQREKEMRVGIADHGCEIVEYILTRNHGEKFQFEYLLDQSTSQRVEMSIAEFTEGINQLPKWISQLITQININLTRISACKPEALRESYAIFKKVERCAEIRTLASCLSKYL